MESCATWFNYGVSVYIHENSRRQRNKRVYFVVPLPMNTHGYIYTDPPDHPQEDGGTNHGTSGPGVRVFVVTEDETCGSSAVYSSVRYFTIFSGGSCLVFRDSSGSSV